MTWFLMIIIVGAIGMTAAAASGRLGSMPDVIDDRPRPDFPDGPLTGDDLTDVAFAVVTRGYSPRQVDALLARLSEQLGSSVGDNTGNSAVVPPRHALAHSSLTSGASVHLVSSSQPTV